MRVPSFFVCVCPVRVCVCGRLCQSLCRGVHVVCASVWLVPCFVSEFVRPCCFVHACESAPVCVCVQIEWLVMRAMSLGLLKGSVDEVDQVVHVSHVKVIASMC